KELIMLMNCANITAKNLGFRYSCPQKLLRSDFYEIQIARLMNLGRGELVEFLTKRRNEVVAHFITAGAGHGAYPGKDVRRRRAQGRHGLHGTFCYAGQGSLPSAMSQTHDLCL